MTQKLELKGFRRVQWWLYSRAFNATGKRKRSKFVPDEMRRYETLYDANGIWRRPFWERLARRLMNRHLLDRNEARVNSVELEVGRLYYNLVMLIKPRLVLETGVSQGYSTCCIAAALQELGQSGKIYCVDPMAIPHLWDGSRLEKSIIWFPAFSHEIVERVNDLQFDMLVIDSEHSYLVAMEEVIAFERLLKSGGYIAMHDVLLFDGVGAVVSQLIRNPRFEVVTLPSPRESGIAIVRKRCDGEPALVFEERFRGLQAVERRSGVPLLWRENGATESETNQNGQPSGGGT
jgi:predicted O-methyltransferase YrrM